MEITLTITYACNGEAGSISVRRVDGDNPREMGTIKFEDANQEKWLLFVLTNWHPYVKLMGQPTPCDPSIKGPTVPC
jgi:hypothetical protein